MVTLWPARRRAIAAARPPIPPPATMSLSLQEDILEVAQVLLVIFRLKKRAFASSESSKRDKRNVRQKVRKTGSGGQYMAVFNIFSYHPST